MTSKRVYLCVGINKYAGPGMDLNGCVNDARDWSELLVKRGYEGTVMLDSEATKSNMVTHLARIVSGLRYRDRFVFTFSGHGTWVPDLDGDEIDGRDEALCCHDYSTGGLLIDDELHNIFSAARYGTKITVISDSCHSGTVARGLMASPMQEEMAQARFVSPADIPVVPVDTEQAIECEKSVAKTRSRTGPVLISGCDDPEYSYDTSFNGRPNGSFSRIAIDTLTTDVKTYREWHKRIRNKLPTPRYPQSPQLGATLYQSFRTPLG